ncbi:hypothetical protein ANO11243_036990 [Dothideomycetidae sp. 11243]|nr:hypothetical protein ANO11243_036990 [fungal sp. No.11243]
MGKRKGRVGRWRAALISADGMPTRAQWQRSAPSSNERTSRARVSDGGAREKARPCAGDDANDCRARLTEGGRRGGDVAGAQRYETRSAARENRRVVRCRMGWSPDLRYGHDGSRCQSRAVGRARQGKARSERVSGRKGGRVRQTISTIGRRAPAGDRDRDRAEPSPAPAVHH